MNTPVEGVVAGDLVGGWDSTKQTADWVVGLGGVVKLGSWLDSGGIRDWQDSGLSLFVGRGL